MNAKNEIHESEHNHPEGLEVCPYLKWRNDDSIRYGFSHVSNFCHKPKKAQPIRLSYQKLFCLTEKYTDCPVLQQERINRLPPDIRGKDIFKRRILRGNPLLIVVLFLALAIVTLLIIISTSRLPSNGVEDASILSPSSPKSEEISPSGSSGNYESLGKTITPSLSTLTPFSMPTKNPSNNSATLSNSGIPVTGSTVMDFDKTSSLRLNTPFTSGLIRDLSFIQNALNSENVYGFMYLVIP